MKKANITFLLTVLFCMTSTYSFAHDIEVENSDGVMLYYKWIKNKTELEVTSSSSLDSKSYTGDLAIPESVEYDGISYPVTSIGSNTFSFCYDLYSLEIPKTINHINRYAFARNNNLKKIIVKDLAAWCENAENYETNPLDIANHLYKDKDTEIVDLVIPEGVSKIGRAAFLGCSGLQSVRFSSPNTEISNSVFEYCSNLNDIYNAANITSVGTNAFSNTAWYNRQPDGLIYIGKSAYQYKGEMPQNTSIVIDEGTLCISGRAFYNCYNLSSITIPSSVSTIGESAFYGCISLTNITIPEGVTSIEYYCFSGCSNLINVEIPNSVTNIGDGAFGNCTLLQNINIPNSVESIGERAFHETAWYKKKYEEHPKGLIYAGKVVYAYKGRMPEGTNLIIEDGTLGIAGGAFRNDEYWMDENEQYKEEHEEICKFNNLISVSIPRSVTNIGSLAFYGCIGVESIILPSGLKVIGPSAFFNCENLKSITLPYSLTTIFRDAFFNCI